MDKEKFVENVKLLCRQRGTTHTAACRKSGAGIDMIRKMDKNGTIPSVEKVQLLAAYLGVTTSELLGEVSPGETKKPTPEIRDGPGEVLSEQDKALLRIFHELNEEGREKLLDTADDMVRSDKYIKIDPAGLGQEA